MVSTYIPVFEAQQPSVRSVNSNEINKEKLTSCIKEAVSKVQNVATIRNGGESLKSNLPEVLQLCESLDKAFLHGLKQLPYGYWPCAKEFTHHNCRVYLENLQNVKTSLGRGRSWICQALNENMLESYIASFVENRKIVEKHYLKPALLRDQHRMQLVLTLMAGLEFVEFDLTIDSTNWDSIGFENSIIRIDLDLEADNLSACSSGVESKSTHTTATPVSMMSLADDDPEASTVEDAFEVTDNTLFIGDCLPNCACSTCIFKEELAKQRHRISHLISLDPDKVSSEDPSETSMEVVHKRITKTRRKKMNSTGSSQEGNVMNNNDLVVDYESQDSNPICDNDESSPNEEACDSGDSKPIVNCFSQENLSDISQLIETQPDLAWLGEREGPEGQEDLAKSLTDSINKLSLVTSLVCVEDDISFKTEPILDEEFSIYDGLKTPATEVNEDQIFDPDFHHWTSNLSIASSNNSFDCQTLDEIEKLQEENQYNDRSLNINNNISLYILLEVFQDDDEKLYKMFLASTIHSQERLELAFVLLSNLCFYVLLPGNHNTGKFKIKTIIPYEKINTVTVSINYQSFVMQCHGGIQKFPIFTGSDFLTRSILSNLELSMRRKGMKELPSMITCPINHMDQLQKLIAKELLVEPLKVELLLCTMVQWENYMGLSPATTPAGPIQEGFLMYIHKLSGSSSWTPAYFQLKAGVLYCYKDSDAHTPDFYFQLQYPHFHGCRRLRDSDRPYSFELQLRAKEKLVLAAANDLEASNWLQAILQTVSLFGKLMDNELKSIHSSSIVLANHVFFMFGENNSCDSVLGKASLSDLVAARVDIDSPTICILEFESGEANSCSGDWILLFSDIDEKEKLLSVVSLAWEELFQVPLNVSPLKDLSLWSRCREHYQRQKKSVDDMLALLDIES